MKAIHRFIVAILEIAAFLAISYGITGSFAFIQDASSPFNLLFVSSAVFIILGQYISEPFFTTPLDAISNSVAAILILLAIKSPSSFLFYEPILVLFIAILVSAVVVLALNALDILPRIKKTLLVITTNLGKSKVLYSAIYLFGAVSYLKDDPTILLIMLIAWVIAVCTNWLEAVIARIIGEAATISTPLPKGSVAESIPERYYVSEFPHLEEFSDKERYLLAVKSGKTRYHLCKIDRVEHLNTGTFISAFAYPDLKVDASELGISHSNKIAGDAQFDSLLLDHNLISEAIIQTINKHEISPTGTTLLGYVDEHSDVESIVIRLLRNESDDIYADIHEGSVIEAKIKNEQVLYQIIGGEDRARSHGSQSTAPHMSIAARKLGVYDQSSHLIKNVMWLPELGCPVTTRKTEEAAASSALSIGKLPGTDCDICIQDPNALITHNTAILGILGVGKSCLSFELIQKVINADSTAEAKIFIIDVTNEYKKELEYYGIKACLPNDTVLIEKLKTDHEKAEKSKDSGGNINVFRAGIKVIIRDFMEGKYDSRVMVLNPENYDVSKQTTDGKSSNYGKPPYNLTPFADLSAAEITRIISEEALDCCKASFVRTESKAKLLMVFEEAHSLIPEWSSAANDGDRNAANGTARVILQGRKYGLGSFVITQRTANVAKSILNQCNTVFALRVFDDTGKQFLENYVGADYAAMLPTLEERHAIAAGKALRLTCPVEIELNDRDDVLNPLPYLQF